MVDYKRLSHSVVPLLYNIQFSVDLNSKTFNGSCEIEININEEIDSFYLNSYNLNIKSAVINYDTVASITSLNDLQKIELKFERKLQLSKKILKIEYDGHLNTSMRGFYHSSYKCADGSIEDIAVTHFEPTNARYAFPCFDEPVFRTPFKITISTDKGYSAISNMSLKSHSIEGSKEIFEFDITPPMSTYLVAFAIGNFERKQLKGTDISVYCRKGTPDDQATFALDVANKAVHFYNKWFNIDYNLPKLDMLAVPDFQGGAMENWGLITFRERALLVSGDNTSVSIKQRVALTISHEIAHMWFGNFVTMEWWTDLWLKEGFATWIEYLCVDHCFPNFEIWTQFVVNEYFRTLKLDSLLSTHPIEVEVKSPDEISEIFDTISYSKGASVIRMLYDYLGEQDFQNGLRSYLQTYKFMCTKTDDLWNSLQSCTDRDVKVVMNSWTRQSGYPLVLANCEFSENNKAIKLIKLSQSRYIQSGDECPEDVLWHIPITIVNAENPQEEIAKFVMKDKEHIVHLNDADKQYTSIFLNPNANGIYRVKYLDKHSIDCLKKCVSLPSWTSADKFSFLEDCFALANSGQFLYTDVLDMLDFMKTEQSFVLWQMIDNNLLDLQSLLDESVYGVDSINKFVTDLALPSYQRLGWSESSTDSHNDILLRPLIISMMSRAQHIDVISEANKIYGNFVNHGTKIPANIRNVVYSIICKGATEVEFKQLSSRFLTAISEDEKASIINSLGKVPLELQNQFKDWLMSETVRKQDKLIGLMSASNSSYKHRELIWTLMQSRWDDFRDMFAGQFLMGHLLNECLGKFSTLGKAIEIEKFFENNDSTSPRNVSQAIEKIKNNHKRMNLHAEKVSTFLSLRFSSE